MEDVERGTTCRATRLLPWTSPEGKPCYLIPDDDGSGYLSRLADKVESVQLAMGERLLQHAEALISDPATGSTELRFLSAQLSESLRAVLRVAESRGARLPVPESDGDDREPGESLL
ncbi:hypothetical protein OG350_20760 [Streptomyces achromogenes]|uniref:Uncharacterized protein n=1 Tax=Streptomyces achromogenes TaxID=67255 RepID=A0ABZ1KU07_STRAH